MENTFRRIGNFITSLVSAIWTAFDIRDVFVLGGLGMFGYGLYLACGLWLSFAVCGPLLMAMGYKMRGSE